uniref:Uncharacterized protein n=1 Tax=Trichobilharzia regenti TaxID=157069 RepID=A0AA85K890_TRIRE|nr:unnamed protein product [Trichobilharzia regenti]
MSTRVSLRQKLVSHLEDADSILRDIVAVATKKRPSVTLLPLIELLLEKDQQLKETYRKLSCTTRNRRKLIC